MLLTEALARTEARLELAGRRLLVTFFLNAFGATTGGTDGLVRCELGPGGGSIVRVCEGGNALDAATAGSDGSFCLSEDCCVNVRSLITEADLGRGGKVGGAVLP